MEVKLKREWSELTPETDIDWPITTTGIEMIGKWHRDYRLTRITTENVSIWKPNCLSRTYLEYLEALEDIQLKYE